MKKLNLFLTLVALSLATTNLSATPSVAVDGKLPGFFSVSAAKKFQFSQGNLLYTQLTSEWSFMEHQYDIIEAQNQNVGVDNVDQDVISHFNWGTKNNPCKTGGSASDYTWGEWGENAISNGGNTANYGWRTLTNAEWDYLINSRNYDRASTVNGQSHTRFAKATVNGVSGLILFPDGGTFAGSEFTTIASLNTKNAAYTTTTCTSAQWDALEEKGCVFLPATGDRMNTVVQGVGTYCAYWSSTPVGTQYANTFYIMPDNLTTGNQHNRAFAFSVRLIYAPAAEIDPAPVAKTLYANGNAQELVTAGTATGGTMYYKLNSGSWTTSIPTASAKGTYQVYYKAVGDATHSDSEEFGPLSVTINNPQATIANPPTAKFPLIYTGAALELVNAGSGVSGGTLKYSLDNSSWNTAIPTATDLGNYTVYWKVEGDASHSDIPSTPIEVSITVPTVTDNSDAAAINAVLALNPENLKVERTIVANGEYNTICLPFDISKSELETLAHPLYGYERLKAFKGATVTGSGQDLYIDIFVEDVDHIDAGVPYLITYPADREGGDIENPVFSGITEIINSPGNVSANGVTFQGMFAQVHIDPYTSSAREQDYLFLGANSQLMWPSSTQTSSDIKMRGFRAYFIIDRNVITPAHAPKGTRARILDAPKTTTGIDELNTTICTKLIENGQLYIIKNGVKYNAQGIIVK